MAKSLREQIAGKCIHFNGISNDKCKAGVEYASVGVKSMPPLFPCFFEGGSCDKVEKPSEEYIQLRLDSISASTNRTMTALNAISAHAGKYVKGKGASGVIECPACKGKLHYSRAGYNGHVHARCETQDCVAFMQ